MKKFLTLLLAIVMVCALAIPAFAEPENFLTEPKWDKGTAGSVSYKDGVATGTGFAAKYSCPSVDILPAIKAALGDEDEIEVTIVFDARINFKGGESNSTEAMMLLRGTNGISGLSGADNADAWLDAYDESLDGEDRFFSNSSGNILKYCSDTIEITDEWQTYSTNIFAYAGQINNPSVIKWNLTLDRFTTFAEFESLEIRNLQIVLTEEAEDVLPEEPDEEDPVEEPDEKPDENKPEENKPEENKPVATQKPQVQVPTGNETIAPEVTAPADVDNTDVPADNNSCNVDTDTILIVAGACALVIIAACVVAIIVVKKKTTK